MKAHEQALIDAALAVHDAYFYDDAAGIAPTAYVMRTKLGPAVTAYRAAKQRASLVRWLATLAVDDETLTLAVKADGWWDVTNGYGATLGEGRISVEDES